MCTYVLVSSYIGGVPRQLPEKLFHLTHLQMRVDLGLEESVRIVVCLLGSSPNLEHLKIRALASKVESGAMQYLKTLQEDAFQLYRLKSVEIQELCGEADFEIVRLLFLWASALEKFKIGIWEESPEVLRMLHNFRRASSRAELIIF